MMTSEEYQKLCEEARETARSKHKTLADEQGAIERVRAAYEELSLMDQIANWSPHWIWFEMGRFCPYEVTDDHVSSRPQP